MSMTKKDYLLVADALNEAKPKVVDQAVKDATGIDEAIRIQWHFDCRLIAHALGFDNDRFDRQRFLKACGIEADDE